MDRCSVCGNEAVYCTRYEGHCYCEEHFIKRFEKRVRRTIRKYNMFGKEERLVVGVSGGKDSLTALYLLPRINPRWEVIGLAIDEGIPGYRDITLKDLEEKAKEWGVRIEVVSFEKEFGYTLDEMLRMKEEKGLPYNACTFCGVFRRYLLNKYARELGATKLVTAHNLDDVVQTFLMDIMRGDFARLSRLRPVVKSSNPKLVPRVKLFYNIPEKEVALYSLVKGIYPSFVECPHARFSMRWEIRKFINKIEEKQPGTKFAMLRTLEAILSNVRPSESIGVCKVCGEPSSSEVCRACQLRMELGILPPSSD